MVYVDDYRCHRTIKTPSAVVESRWSHMTADTEDELHEFAQVSLGISRRWFEPATRFPESHPLFAGQVRAQFHYDVSEDTRILAVTLGAQSVPWRSLDWMDAFIPGWLERSIIRRFHKKVQEELKKNVWWRCTQCGHTVQEFAQICQCRYPLYEQAPFSTEVRGVDSL
jgi:Protein of unknown function (DUF4031)